VLRLFTKLMNRHKSWAFIIWRAFTEELFQIEMDEQLRRFEKQKGPFELRNLFKKTSRVNEAKAFRNCNAKNTCRRACDFCNQNGEYISNIPWEETHCSSQNPKHVPGLSTENVECAQTEKGDFMTMLRRLSDDL